MQCINKTVSEKESSFIFFFIFFYFPTDAVILLWKLNDSKESEPLVFQDEDEAQLNKENWTVVKTLR